MEVIRRALMGVESRKIESKVHLLSVKEKQVRACMHVYFNSCETRCASINWHGDRRADKRKYRKISALAVKNMKMFKT
jgi:hypothetical protein